VSATTRCATLLLVAEGRLRHQIERRDRRMRTLEYDTRDTALVCEFEGISRLKAT
jgi:hypothetical protein